MLSTILFKLTCRFVPIAWCLLLFIGMATPVNAGFGISPGVLENKNIKPGMTFKQTVYLSIGNPVTDTPVTIEPDLGAMSNWITYDSGLTFTMPKGQKLYPLVLTISIPKDAVMREYRGAIRFKAGTDLTNNTGVAIIRGVKMDVSLGVNTANVTRLVIESLSLTDVAYGEPLHLIIRTRNEGNTTVAPTKAVLELYRQNGKDIIETLETVSLKEIEAFTTGDSEAYFTSSMPPGQYFATVKVYLKSELLREEQLPFAILPASLPQENQQAVVEAPKVSQTVPVSQEKQKDELVWLYSAVAVTTLLILLLIIILVAWKRGLLSRLKTKNKMTEDLGKTKVSPLPSQNTQTTKARAKIPQKSAITTLMTILILILSLPFIYHKYPVSLVDLFDSKPKDFCLKQEECRDTDNTQKEIVLGSSEVEKANLFVVTEPIKPAVYNIYALPDIASTVIYEAKQGETFTAVALVNQWYKVRLPGNQEGWIPEKTVKRN